ncbi:related to MAM33 - mitochondrial acidic matrix protein [Fusarium torulosum]|uniref:Related to MAM33 - mitochondrial acidic matrix protein n=1 Tax=Fusarium torulosum TaxID=33205 RepID=A0AAE8M4U0_9HYPO|nr:related to MAM33 - mitochondrial acidic matrix protein [Fusarium torulosum]
MFSARNVARSAPRVVSRLSGAALRQTTRPSAFIKASSALRPAQSAFSTTVFRKAAEADGELLAKLESEIKIEEDMKASEQDPASIKDFLNNSAFELIDTPGQEVVKLTRTYGEEKITVSFSIADITNYDPYAEENALEDEGFEDESAQGSQRSARANEELDEELEDDAEEENAAPINLSIVVEKPGKASGALNIDATAQDGQIVVENLFYYDDAKVAKVESPDAAQKRADVYPGPPFGSLDDDLQVLMERFLEERGITQALAIFVPDYVDVKEQREYTRWLSNVKAFIDA